MQTAKQCNENWQKQSLALTPSILFAYAEWAEMLKWLVLLMRELAQLGHPAFKCRGFLKNPFLGWKLEN
jgi:hypothetical protein